MKITPLDIQNKKFKKKFRGLDADEVASFLEVVREQLEDLVRENYAMKDQIRQMENKLKEYRDIEETMKGVLVSTQQMVHEHKVNAQKESEIIKKEAKLKAQEILMETQDKLIKFHEEISELKRIKKNFKEEVIRLIESHRRMVEMINAEEG